MKPTSLLHRAEIGIFWVGIGLLTLSAIVGTAGMAMRAYISGWAPVTNMYETILLVALVSTYLALWMTLEPLLKPMVLTAWEQSRISSFWTILSRIVLSVATFIGMVHVCFHDYSQQHGFFAATLQFFHMPDPVDMFVVLALTGTLVWFIPRILLTVILLPVSLFSIKREDIPQQILHRKAFFLCCAAVAVAAGLFAFLNTRDFNPHIRPIMAVLRSNFWLVIHVTAIVISYAIGLVAWTLSLWSLCGYIFGHYEIHENLSHQVVKVRPPVLCEKLAPYILVLVQLATLFLAIGTILGGRWADYSWGRFWGWDPKEVWALITLLVYLVTIHGYRARYYGSIGVAVGAIFGAVAVIITWYGFNFVFKIGRHAYGNSAGDSNLVVFYTASVVGGMILVLCLTAIIRYLTVKHVLYRRNSS